MPFLFPDRSPRKLGPTIIHDSLIRQEGGANTLRCGRSLPGVKPARDLTVYTMAVSSWQLSFYVETGNRNRTGRWKEGTKAFLAFSLLIAGKIATHS